MNRFFRRLAEVRKPSDLWKFIDKAAYRIIGKKIRMYLLHRSIKHICGPIEIRYGHDEAIVVCVVRDGELYIKSFIEHYLALGATHIIFLDNKSNDKTVNIAAKCKKVTILQTHLPFKKYEPVMREYLIIRFGKLRWSICADIDELFDYPYSDVLSLKEFLKYLNKHSYTAVVAQMLDMFCDKPLLNIKSQINDSLKDLYTYCDISDIQKVSYKFSDFGTYNIVSNKNIQLHIGGIRKTIFGTDGLYLTKHPLIFLDNKIIPKQTEHEVRNANIADFSAVLLHYKFLGNFYNYVLRELREENFYSDSVEWKHYFKTLEKNPDLQLRQATSKEFKGVNSLIDSSFLVVSDAYMSWIKDNVN